MCNKNMSCLKGCKCTRDAGLLMLRIAVGVPFIFHGLSKVMDLSGTVGFFSSIGISPILTYLISFGELIAGIMILLGVWSYVGGYIVSIIMLGAFFIMKKKMPFIGGYELDFAFFFGGLAIAMLGSGKYSLIKECCQSGICKDGKCVPLAGSTMPTELDSCNCESNGGCNETTCATCDTCKA